MKFSLISMRDANPLVFTLIFNASNGPPTDVTCTDGTKPFSVPGGDLSHAVVIQVTVTVRMRQTGTYQCTVSNTKVTNGPILGQTCLNATSSNIVHHPITG